MKERKEIDIANQSGEIQVSIGVVEHIQTSPHRQILVTKFSNTCR